MSDSFQLEPIGGKSWSDIVDEEEEYNRLHPEEEEEEEEEEAIKETSVLTGTKASRWATISSNSPQQPIKKTGSMASKWASPTGGRRNYYYREFDSHDRNGGFNNKDNFKRNRKVDEDNKAPPPFSLTDDINQSSQVKPLPWGSLEEKKTGESVVKEVAVSIKEGSLKKERESVVEEIAVSIKEGSLEEEEERESVVKEVVVPPIKEQVKPLPIYTWGSLEELESTTIKEKVIIAQVTSREEKPLPQILPDSSSDWNSNVSWSEIATPVVQEQHEKPMIIKADWKSKLPVAVQDNSSGWKSFADKQQNITNQVEIISLKLGESANDIHEISIKLSDLDQL